MLRKLIDAICVRLVTKSDGPRVWQIAKLNLQPNDTLIVRAKGRLSSSTFERLKKMLSDELKPRMPEGCKILIFDDSVDFAVISGRGASIASIAEVFKQMESA